MIRAIYKEYDEEGNKYPSKERARYITHEVSQMDPCTREQKKFEIEGFFYVGAVLASGAASTPANDSSSAITINLATSLAGSSLYAVAPGLCATRAHAAYKRRKCTESTSPDIRCRECSCVSGRFGKGARLLRDDSKSFDTRHRNDVKSGASTVSKAAPKEDDNRKKRGRKRRQRRN